MRTCQRPPQKSIVDPTLIPRHLQASPGIFRHLQASPAQSLLSAMKKFSGLALASGEDHGEIPSFMRHPSSPSIGQDRPKRITSSSFFPRTRGPCRSLSPSPPLCAAASQDHHGITSDRHDFRARMPRRGFGSKKSSVYLDNPDRHAVSRRDRHWQERDPGSRREIGLMATHSMLDFTRRAGGRVDYSARKVRAR
jgi:hypothetical protein